MINNKDSFEKMGDSVVGKIYPYLIEDLKKYYNLPFANKTIAEIGTGPGFILKELQKEDFKKIIGIDISLEMLIRAQKRIEFYKNIQLINARAENLPFKSSSFDLIISRGSVFFWNDLNKAFKEIYRVLNDDGFLLIGGGYGISTPENIINQIQDYMKRKISKNEKPKVKIDNLIEIMQKIGGHCEIINKPKHGFWISWKK